jgi:lysophospholipase L1-like esterase
LGWSPLRWVGVRSYGIYLWHWPIIVLTSPAEGGVSPTTAALQVAATLAVAALSWRYIEEPVRRGALARLWRRARPGAGRLVPRHALAVSGPPLAVLILPLLGLAGALPAASAGLASTAAGVSPPPALSAPASGEGSSAPGRADRRPTRTSCRRVVYVGDSTSEGEISPDYIPHPRRRLRHQLANAGVKSSHMEISGARSIVEGLHGQANAATVTQELVSRGFHHCWILALGTNDTADVYVGSNVDQRTRIARMMSIIGHRPVLWIDAISLRRSGPYSAEMMQRWNRALVAACRRYPTMRIFDWAAHAKPGWFIPDGMHYTSLGYEKRSRLIAGALVKAFPRNRPPAASCLVR